MICEFKIIHPASYRHTSERCSITDGCSFPTNPVVADSCHHSPRYRYHHRHHFPVTVLTNIHFSQDPPRCHPKLSCSQHYIQLTHRSACNDPTPTPRTYAATKLFAPVHSMKSEDSWVLIYYNSETVPGPLPPRPAKTTLFSLCDQLHFITS